MSDRPLSERVRDGEILHMDGQSQVTIEYVITEPQRQEIAALEAEVDRQRAVIVHDTERLDGKMARARDRYYALEERLLVSEAKREVEREAADDWQERYEAMKRIADAYHARLEVDDDECSADCICKE